MKNNLIYFPDVWQDSIEELYEKMTMEQLKKIAKIHDMAGTYKYNKKQLISVLASYVLDPEVMQEFFIYSTEEELDLFDQFLYEPEDMEEDDEELEYVLQYFFSGGYLLKDKKQQLVIPEEVRRVYEKINTDEFQEKHEQYNIAYNYCCGITSLYGMASLEEITAIYNYQQNKKMQPQEMLFQIYLPSLKRKDWMVYHDGRLTERYLLEQDDIVERILKEREAYEPYIPAKSEIYDLAHGLEEVTMIFAGYLMDDLRFSVQESMGITEFVSKMLKIGVSPKEVFQLLQRQKIMFLNRKQMEEFVQQLLDFWMELRLYTLYGHKMSEIE